MYIGLSQWDCESVIFVNIYHTVNVSTARVVYFIQASKPQLFRILIMRETFNNKYARDEIKLKIITR